MICLDLCVVPAILVTSSFACRVGLYTPRIDEKRTEANDVIKQTQQQQQQQQQLQQEQQVQEQQSAQEDSNKENSVPQPQSQPAGEDRVADCSGSGESDSPPQIIPWRAQLRKTNSTLSLLE